MDAHAARAAGARRSDRRRRLREQYRQPRARAPSVGWSRTSRRRDVRRGPRRLEPDVDSELAAPVVRHRRQRQIGIDRHPDRSALQRRRPAREHLGGFTRLGGPFFRPQFQTSQVYQLSDNLTWTAATHTYKFGIERRRDLVDYIDLRALNGLLNFTDGRYTGSAYGDFLLGLAQPQGLTLFHEADLYSAMAGSFTRRTRGGSTRNLTFNYGLRYEYFTPTQDSAIPADEHRAGDRRDRHVDRQTGSTLRADADSPRSQRLRAARRRRLTPDARTSSLRAGYGIFYQQHDRYGSESQLALNPPQLIDVTLDRQRGQRGAGDDPAQRLRAGDGGERRTRPACSGASRIRTRRRRGAAVQPRPGISARRGDGRRSSTMSATGRATAASCAI